jgi:hypothetical protein
MGWMSGYCLSAPERLYFGTFSARYGRGFSLPLSSHTMKRFFGILAAVLVAGGLSAQAQTTPATGTMSSSSSKMTTTKTSQTPGTTTTRTSTSTNPAGLSKTSTMSKNQATMSKSSKMTTPSGMTKTSTSTKMKADGTPDMRYKVNKTKTTTTKVGM